VLAVTMPTQDCLHPSEFSVMEGRVGRTEV